MTAGAAGPPGPVMPHHGNTNQQESIGVAGATNPRRFTIDVGPQVAELERVLRAGADLARCMEARTILARWQSDEMLDDASRMKARLLVREFAADGWDHLWRR